MPGTPYSYKVIVFNACLELLRARVSDNVELASSKSDWAHLAVTGLSMPAASQLRRCEARLVVWCNRMPQHATTLLLLAAGSALPCETCLVA